MKPLNPIMAVLAIASVGVFPLRALAADGVPPGVVIAVEDTNSITKLTDILSKNAVAKDDASARVADFLLLPDAATNKTFVAADVGVKELQAVALDWAKKQTPGNLAMLYFVVGVGGPKAPDWVMNDDLLKKTVFPERKAEGRLRKALERFADPATAQIKKAKEKDDTIAFLNTALTAAQKIFDDPRPTPVVDASIDGNNNTGVKPPDTRRGAGSGLGAASQQYTMKELYLDGAEVRDIAGAKDQHSRRISMKIYTRRDPVTNALVNEIGIFDITDQNNIFGQRFPAGGGDQSFILDDRTPGHKRYELKFKTLPGGERQVVFGRPGEGGSKIATTVSTLYNKRADQVADLNNVVKVGDQEFYVAPQGGKMGVLAMYPKGLIDSRRGPGLDPRDLIPGLYAEVSSRDADGRNQNAPRGALGGPHLGSVGGKDYRLEFNAASGFWEVKDGPGNLPPKPKAEGETSGGGGGATDPATPPGKPIAELEMLLLKLPECKKGDTAKLAKDLEKTFGLVTCNKTNKPEDMEVFVLVPASVRTEQQMKYSSITAEGNQPAMHLLGGRMVDHYLVLQFDKQVHYLDLLKPTARGFDMAGFVADGKTGGDANSGFKEVPIFMDALSKYMGVTGQDTKALDEVPGRMAKMFGGKPFVYIQASYRPEGSGKQLVVNGAASGGGFEVWPKFDPPKGDGPESSQYASTGPANAMDGSVGSVDSALLDGIDLDKSMKGVAIHRTADIAIYQSKDPTGKSDPNQYFVMFRYDALDPKDPAKPDGAKEKRTFRQKQFVVFDSSNPLPSGLGFQGLVGQTVIKDRVSSGFRFIPGTNTERGVLAVFQEKQVSGENVKDKAANCVGPIIWWGFKDRDAALKVCREDKF